MEAHEQSLPEVLDEATSILSKFVIPLYEDDVRGRPSSHASCFFIRSGAQHFAISAAHVFETLATRNLYYYITPDITRKLTGKVWLNSWQGDREDDPIDIAILRLTGDHQPPYPSVDKFAMDISYAHPTSLPRSNKHYVIVGFPASRSAVNPIGATVEAVAYGYRADSLPDTEYAKHRMSPETHLLMPLDLKRGFDSHGAHRNFPKPKGMSGSPIWTMYDYAEGEQSRVFPLVAVGTKYWQSKRLLVATDISVVLEMIRCSV